MTSNTQRHKIRYADDGQYPPRYMAQCACGWVCEWDRSYRAIEKLAKSYLHSVS